MVLSFQGTTCCIWGECVEKDGKTDFVEKKSVEREVTAIPKETYEFFNGDEIRSRVFYEKYALKDLDGTMLERTPDQMWSRVSKVIADVEATPEKRAEWYEKFNWLLGDFRFLPGGRILFAAGQQRKSTLIVIMSAPLLPCCPMVCVVSLNMFMKDTEPVETTAELFTGVFLGLSMLISVPTPPP